MFVEVNIIRRSIYRPNRVQHRYILFDIKWKRQYMSNMTKRTVRNVLQKVKGKKKINFE